MDLDGFWQHIDLIDATALEREDEAVALAPLIAGLARLPDAEIFSFHDHLSQALYDIDGMLYAEAAGASGGSSDGFLYARCYVVAKGRLSHYVVKASPGNFPKDDRWCEALHHVARDAWGARHGRDPRDFPHTAPRSYESFSRD